MYLQIKTEAEDQQSRDNAELRLKEIDSQDEKDAMNEVLKTSQETLGTCPTTLKSLIPELRKVELPRNRSFSLNDRSEIVDPTGVPYRIDANTCKAELDFSSKIPKMLQ
jgi:hypothetical protein